MAHAHTPGPWIAERNPEHHPNCDRPDPAHHVYGIYAADPDREDREVCLATLSDYWGTRAAADAALIAEAPDLYFALMRLCEAVELGDEWTRPHIREAYEQGRQILRGLQQQRRCLVNT